MDSKTQQTRQPVITKTVQTQRIGIQVYAISRYAIGYVMRGRKYIYYGDTRYEVKQGDLFYLDIGNHYIEDIPEEGKPYEQITLFYSPENLHEILTTLSINYQLEIDSTHSCSACDTDLSHVSYPAWNMVKHFFSNVNQYLKEDLFSEAPTAEKLKTTELVYLILSNPECCIKSRILNDANMAAEGFEQIIQQHIFDGLSTEELAALCHKSLTSFKKEFVKHFHEPPHKWFLKRRLTHSPAARIDQQIHRRHRFGMQVHQYLPLHQAFQTGVRRHSCRVQEQPARDDGQTARRSRTGTRL